MKQKMKRGASYKILFSPVQSLFKLQTKGFENLVEFANKRFQQSICFWIYSEGGEMSMKQWLKFASGESCLLGNGNILWQIKTQTNQLIQEYSQTLNICFCGYSLIDQLTWQCGNVTINESFIQRLVFVWHYQWKCWTTLPPIANITVSISCNRCQILSMNSWI